MQKWLEVNKLTIIRYLASSFSFCSFSPHPMRIWLGANDRLPRVKAWDLAGERCPDREARDLVSGFRQGGDSQLAKLAIWFGHPASEVLHSPI